MFQTESSLHWERTPSKPAAHCQGMLFQFYDICIHLFVIKSRGMVLKLHDHKFIIQYSCGLIEITEYVWIANILSHCMVFKL